MMSVGERETQIFLCYTPDDTEQVEVYYQQLRDAGLKPWMDTQDILGGEVRESVIRQAVQASDFLLVLLSNQAVNQSGPFHKTLRLALEVWQEKPEGRIYLIPVRLDACELPASLRSFQAIDLFQEHGLPRLMKTIQAGIERLHPPSVHLTPEQDSSRQQPSTGSSIVVAVKRKSLEKRLGQLTEEYTAVSDQMGRMLNEADSIKLKRQLEHLEQELLKTENELGNLGSS